MLDVEMHIMNSIILSVKNINVFANLFTVIISLLNNYNIYTSTAGLFGIVILMSVS